MPDQLKTAQETVTITLTTSETLLLTKALQAFHKRYEERVKEFSADNAYDVAAACRRVSDCATGAIQKISDALNEA